MRDGDAGIDDFDPTTMYEGEGDACRFSIECSHRQICVDDACTRHERIEAGSVEFGEPRWLGPADIEASPIHERATTPWEVVVGGARVRMLNWIVPGRDTSQLVVLLVDPENLLPEHCQVLIVGQELRVVTLPGLGCSTATVRDDGELAVVGRDVATGEAVILRQAPNGATRFRVGISDEIQAALMDGGHPPLTERGAVSMIFDGDRVLIAMRVPHQVGDTISYDADIPGLVFVTVDGDGVPSIVDTGPETLAAGDLGYLVRDGEGVKAIIGAVDPDTLQYADLAVLRMDDGGREPLPVGVADQVRFAQPEPTRWVFETGVAVEDLVMPSTVGCRVSVFDSGSAGVAQLPIAWPVCGRRNPLLRENYFAEAATFMPAWLEHARPQLVDYTDFEVYELDGTVETTLDYAVGRDPTPFAARIAAVSRFHMTFEGIFGAQYEGPPFDWFERALVRR
jgi:hypothetical protein